MPKTKKSAARFPTAAELKRIILTIQHTGLDIVMIELEPSQIRIATSSATQLQNESLSAFDLWKMQTDGDPTVTGSAGSGLESESAKGPLDQSKTRNRAK